jgi:hypothetical protein
MTVLLMKLSSAIAVKAGSFMIHGESIFSMLDLESGRRLVENSLLVLKLQHFYLYC